MLLVQEYLKTHTFNDLVRDHGVYPSFSKSGHKFSLNYDQLEAKESDSLAQECRGLILARTDGRYLFEDIEKAHPGEEYDQRSICPGDTTILAFPMKRFFNYGQSSAANIDWSDPKLTVLEKLDGTLCIVYYDKFIDKWCVATRSVPEADLIMDNNLFTFRTLFEKALLETSGKSFEEYTKMLNRNATYCFELTTPYNRIVVYYPNSRVTLLAIRLMADDYPEFNIHTMGINDLWGVPIVQTHQLDTVEKTIEWVSSLNPMEHEGVVVKQGDKRIKVKNPAYVAYNRVRDTLASSERNIMELILTEKDDDVVPMLPEEIVKNLQKIKSGLQIAIKQHEDWYNFIRLSMEDNGITDKKSFALTLASVSKHTGNKLWAAPFFQIFDGKASSMKDFITKSRKDGTWGNSFLDKMLELSKSYQD